MSTEPDTSVVWNGVTYTAHANKGARFGTGTGASPDEARAAAIKDLGSEPTRTAPVVGGAGPAVMPDPGTPSAKPAR